uniref:Uncharacterized protein n=1 Tax=Ciona intestinalis TaxID=7719 RepID=H2XKY7_CIOIN
MPKWRDKITVIGTSDMHSPNTVTEGVLSNMNQQVMNLQDDTPIFSSFIQCSMTIRVKFFLLFNFIQNLL